ncbi:Serine protease inhibitor [Nesidiocoris tenuis]|uniref:Serine protease inhibitor n=1 Tax=Nesidiocoris tenuis TaxID=355587 RepID=A0ABN7AYM3_9HEMI|nr:Serine protease inhibitor [Nesidiocoris tenuis]
MKEFLLILIAIPAISMQCLSGDDSAVTNEPGARIALFKGQQQFTLNMLRQLESALPEDNVFFSPYSVYNALLLAYFASANQTEASIKETLALPPGSSKVDTMRAYGVEKYFQEMRSVNGSESYELSSANRLFVSPKQEVRDCMKTLFNNEIEETDFQANPAAAVEKINSWVAEKTKNQIKDLLNEGNINGNTQLVLANAAYFKGIWKSKFSLESTRKELFYQTSAKNFFVTMMRQKSTFNHMTSEKLGAHVLEMPYKGDDVSLFIILTPFPTARVSHMLKRLTVENFQEIVSLDAMIPRPVEVAIPKFTIEQEVELTPVLESMGIGDLFKPTGDLSSLTGKPGVSLDAAIHKAKITLDEQGTTAAAATAIFNFRSSRPLDPAKFLCNHPFVYFIFDKVSQTVLFAGVFKKPPTQPSQ